MRTKHGMQKKYERHINKWKSRLASFNMLNGDLKIGKESADLWQKITSFFLP